MKEFSKNEKDKFVSLVGFLLAEPKIDEMIHRDFAPQKRDHRHVQIVMDQAKIRFGKYSWSGFGSFCNNLIKCYEEISFSDFFIKTWDALVIMTEGMPAHNAVIEQLSRETLLKGIHEQNYLWIADRFLDVCRHLTKDGYWKTIGTESPETPHHNNGCPYADGVKIQVEHGEIKSGPIDLRVVDSIGDTFEILTGRWVGGMRRS